MEKHKTYGGHEEVSIVWFLIQNYYNHVKIVRIDKPLTTHSTHGLTIYLPYLAKMPFEKLSEKLVCGHFLFTNYNSLQLVIEATPETNHLCNI